MVNNTKITFVFAREGKKSSTTYGGFANRLQKTGNLQDTDVDTVALENLLYILREDGTASIIDTVTQKDLRDNALVYFKSWQSLPNEAAALARYLLHQGVTFADTLALGKGNSKLVTMYRQWGEGIRIPNTIYTTKNENLIKLLHSDMSKDLIGEKFILKDVEGAKGKLNFYVTANEAEKILDDYPDVRFMCQRYVPNDGDIRIGVYGSVARFVLSRVGNGTSHLNNTSAGGKGTLVPATDLSSRVRTLAEKAARASELQVAGVDVIQDKHTKKWFVLEVNQGSQIVTGAFTEENMRVFIEGLKSMTRERKARTRQSPRKVIGRRAHAKLSELNVVSVIAKIDTGAYSSTLHAEDIKVIKDANGSDILQFVIAPSEQLQTKNNENIIIKTNDFFVQRVRSSNGQVQERYSIRTKISLDGIRFPATLTLSDRSEMGYPLLIGRRLLRSRFIVNVELNESNELKWNY